MTLVDYIRRGDYDELSPYLTGLDAGRYRRALYALTDILREADGGTTTCDDLAHQSAYEELVTTLGVMPQFDGNPRSVYWQAWIEAVEKRHELDDEASRQMLSEAISIVEEHEHMSLNPKRNMRNYNRYIATQMSMLCECYDSYDCLLCLTTSAEYGFTEEDLRQIGGFMKHVAKNVIVHTREDEAAGKSLQIDMYICLRDTVSHCTANDDLIEEELDALFNVEPAPVCVFRSDFERVLNYNDICSLWTITTQCGVDGLIDELQKSSQYYLSPNAGMVVMCIEYFDESKLTYDDSVKRIFDTISNVLPHATLTWGFRENRLLPQNGYKLTLLTDVPADSFLPSVMYSAEEV